MIFFYKNYDEYSRLATFFSMIGGLFYAAVIVCVIAGFSAEDLGIGGGIAMGAVMAILGFCNSALAKAIAKKHGAPIGNNNSNTSSRKSSEEKINIDVNVSNNKKVESEVTESEQIQIPQTVIEPEPILVGGIQESIDSLAALNEKEKELKSENESQNENEWKCIYCGTMNTGKFCHECGKPKLVAKFCPNCGEKLQPGQKFCSNCGSKIII